MVVEDDDFTRSTVVSALQIQGIDVVGQSSAVAPAMMLFKELKPDAVVLDLDLGAGPNGIDLAKESDIPVLAVLQYQVLAPVFNYIGLPPDRGPDPQGVETLFKRRYS